MFKNLATFAVLGATAGLSQAADVTIYGVVDTALVYTHSQGEGSDHGFEIASGLNEPSRFGLIGSEKLANGMEVSFKLENEFQIDDGTMNHDNRLFGREASVSVHTDFGTVSFGRMGGVGSSAGTYDLVYATADVFDGGDNAFFPLVASDRYDNMVTYQSPTFGGVQATVQYSFQADSKQEPVTGGKVVEGESSADRYASAAVTGEFGKLNVVAAYEFQNYASVDTGASHSSDAHTVSFGGNYDCGIANTFFMVQYFNGVKSLAAGQGEGDFGNDYEGLDGYGLHLGALVPVAGGDLSVGAYFADARIQGLDSVNDSDVTAWSLSARYVYPLSKRTSVYAGLGYGEDDVVNIKEKHTQAYAGLSLAF